MARALEPGPTWAHPDRPHLGDWSDWPNPADNAAEESDDRVAPFAAPGTFDLPGLVPRGMAWIRPLRPRAPASNPISIPLRRQAGPGPGRPAPAGT